MAIDFTDKTSIVDTLKAVYGPTIEQQFAQEETLYNKLPKSNAKIGGTGYEVAVTWADPQGVGGRLEGEKIPDPLVGKFDRTTITPKQIYSMGRLSGLAIEASKSNEEAFMDAQNNQIQGMYRAVKSDLNRQCWGDGFGALATLSEASDALATGAEWTITCDNDTGVRNLKPGMLIDFFDGAAVDQSSTSSRVASVDVVNKTAEMEGNDGTYKANHPIAAFRAYTIATDAVPDGAVAVKLGAREATHASSNTAREMTGFDGVFDDGTNIATFQNIVVATYPFWKANILDNSSVDREISEDLMFQACDVNKAMSGEDVTIAYMGQGQMRKLANLFLGDVRFTPQKLDGGYSTLSFAAGTSPVELVVDPVATPGKIFFTTKDAIQKFELMPLGFMNRDQVMHMRSGYDEWDFGLALYGNMGVTKRSNLTVLKDLVEPSQF